MATSTLPLLVVFFLAATATAAVSARSSKTLFYLSATTTTAYYPYNSLHRNSNTNSILRGHNLRYLTIISTTTSRFSNHGGLSLNFESNSLSDEVSQFSSMTSSNSPLKFYSTSNSVRDRARDMMSVVAALLLGMGCGALTTAAMYFVRALFCPSRFHFDDISSSPSDDDGDDDVTVAKKLGYVAIPTKPKLVDDVMV